MTALVLLGWAPYRPNLPCNPYRQRVEAGVVAAVEIPEETETHEDFIARARPATCRVDIAIADAPVTGLRYALARMPGTSRGIAPKAQTTPAPAE
jgi:hypothetical protein